MKENIVIIFQNTTINCNNNSIPFRMIYNLPSILKMKIIKKINTTNKFQPSYYIIFLDYNIINK